MASSGYTAITFVANEQPTTAKWNLIGSNDSSFNLGTGLEDSVIINRHLASGAVTGDKITNYKTLRQDDTTNSTETAARILTGWGVIPVSTGVSIYEELITFNGAFTNKPVVVGQYSGDLASIVNNGGANSIEGIVTCKVHTILTTGFRMYFAKPNGTNWGGNGYGYYNWIAIGT